MDLEKNYITKKSRNVYLLAAAGQGAIYAMISSWILRYYTDVMGLELAFVMGLMWFARILNAIADPVVGTLVDLTKTKNGKMRSYLRYTPFIISLLSILLFCDFGIKSQAWKCIYAGFVYVAWGLAYSAADVPLWGLPCTMTNNGEERDKLLSSAKFLNSIGGAIPTVVVSLLMADSLLGLQKGIFFSAIGIFVLGTIPFALVYPNSKEITHNNVQRVSALKQLKYLFKNKILMLVVLCGIIGFGRYLIQSAYTYAAEYVFVCDSAFINEYKQVIGFALIGIGMLPTMLLTPLLIKKFTYKWIMIWAGIISAVAMGLFYLVGVLTEYNFYWAMLFLFLSGIPLGVYNIVVTQIVGECVDYLEWKEGVRLEGLTTSMSTFIAKIGAALSSGLIPFMLLICGYDAEYKVQTPKAQTGIFLLITLIPAGSLLLSIIPMIFYDFVGKKRELAMKEIAEKRAVEEQVNDEETVVVEDKTTSEC